MTEQRVSKQQRLDMHDNERRQSLDKYEGEDNRYIHVFFDSPYFFP